MSTPPAMKVPPAIKLTGEEQMALYGADAAVVQVYVMAIRPRMDFATGIVGRAVRISYQAIKEWTERHARPGVRFKAYSRDQIRRIVDQLVLLGLVRKEGDSRELVLRCLLAETDNCAAKKAAKGSPYTGTAGNGAIQNDSRGYPQRAQTAKAATHPVTGKTLKPTPPNPPVQGHEGEQVVPPTPAARAGELDPPHRRGARAQQLSEQRHKTTNRGGKGASPPRSEKRRSGPLRWKGDCLWPVDLEPDDRAYIARMERAIGEGLNQRVLDELRGAMEAGIVKSPWGFLANLFEQAQGQGWMPEYADAVAAGRIKRAETLAVIAAQEAAHAAKLGVKPRPMGGAGQVPAQAGRV